MHKEELQELLQKLQPEGSAQFAIQDAHTRDAYVQANAAGLRLVARELLRASLSIDYVSDDTQVPISRYGLPEAGEVHLTHVRPWTDSVLALETPEAERPLRRKMLQGGVVLGALVLAGSALIGMWTWVHWLF